jgi:hypothetical protein
MTFRFFVNLEKRGFHQDVPLAESDDFRAKENPFRELRRSDAVFGTG